MLFLTRRQSNVPGTFNKIGYLLRDKMETPEDYMPIFVHHGDPKPSGVSLRFICFQQPDNIDCFKSECVIVYVGCWVDNVDLYNVLLAFIISVCYD